MDAPFFTPEQFVHYSGTAQIDVELRRWLRSQVMSERVDFINTLFPHNYRYALALVRSSMLPTDEIARMLRYWLSLGTHNCSQGLIDGLVPVLGERRFWSIAAQAELSPAMSDFLNYHSHGKLEQYRNQNLD